MRVLAVGAHSDAVNNKFTGQSIMFDGIIDQLRINGDIVKTIDISTRFKLNSIVLRCLDYAIVLEKVFYYLLIGKYDLGYIITSQSKNGFLRDYAIISLFRLFKVKVIAHQYGANYNQLLQALNFKEKKRLMKMLDYVSLIIVEGNYMKEQYAFLHNYKDKVHVIPNGLPTVGKNAMHPKTYAKENPFRLFYLSNLIWSKGYFDVLLFVDLLVNHYHKEVECVFAGAFMSSVDDVRPGVSNKEDFSRFVKEHGLGEVVTYYPGLYGEQKDEMFAKANVFLLPTYYINEGQPVSIIEAMAYGCVPIVTKYRHIPMMVTEENGCYIEPKKPEEMARAVMYLMDHPDVYAKKSLNCINDYKDKFTFDKYASQVLQCMSEVANGQGL